jgi:alpha-1,2-mannosyltransferase
MDVRNVTVAARWVESHRFRAIALTVLAVVLLVEGYVAVFKRENDFAWHYNQGKYFLAGDPFAGDLDWYPLPRAMINALPALLPAIVARAVWYALAVGGLWVCYRLWDRLVAPVERPNAPGAVAAGVLSVGLLMAYVLRDLDECGLQLLLLLMLSAAAWAVSHGRAVQAGFWLATALVYKSTPLLFLPLLLWKRQWRAAGWMIAFVALWAIAPAAWLGWERTAECHRQWIARVVRLTQDKQAYPSLMESEPPKPQNQSLQAAFARYLESYPAGHPLHMDHPAYFQFGRLDTSTAKRGVTVALLILAMALAIRIRRPWRFPEGTTEFAAVWAATCLLCALLSPLCWKQHLVLALPCAFLVLRSAAAQRDGIGWRLAALLTIAAVVNLTRHGIVGREFSAVLMTYKLDTFAMLLLMSLALATSHRAAKAVVEKNPPFEHLSAAA